MFVVDLIRDALTSPTQQNNGIMEEMKVIVTKIFGNWKKCSSAAVMIWVYRNLPLAVITHTITALSLPHIVTQFI